MTRYGMLLRVKPEAEKVYVEYHAAVWPAVLEIIRECNIRNYSIFLKDGLLFAYYEYHGADFEADMKKMASYPTMRKWWDIMEPMQDPIPTRKPGEWWARMDEVFHTE